MLILETNFNGLYEIQLKNNEDTRGWFMRTYDADLFKENIKDFSNEWKQINHSFSSQKGTFRGLHYQEAPFQESKCVRCLSGAVIDYALDLRKNSETYLHVFEIELSAKNRKMIYIPKGFAHGFFTLEDNTELIYMHDEFYNPNYERGVYFQDKRIKTLINIAPIIMSEKDKNYKNL